MEGVDKEDIWECLRRDDGVQGNSVKVAYMLLRDKHRAGRDLAEFEGKECDAWLAAMDPRNTLSPNALSPAGELEDNPFEAQFNAEYDDGEEDDDIDDGLDFYTHPIDGEHGEPCCTQLFTPPPQPATISHLMQLPDAHGLLRRRSNIGQSSTL